MTVLWFSKYLTHLPGNIMMAENYKRLNCHVMIGWSVLSVFLVSSLVIYRVFQEEKEQQCRFKMLIRNSSPPIKQIDSVLESVIHTHESVREELFRMFFKGAETYDSLDAADDAVKYDLAYADSWQRKLSGEAKQKLKTVLLRRAIATLQLYQNLRKEYTAKNVLYQKGLLNPEHFSIVQNQHQRLIDDIDWIIFEANCIEENWGSGTEGIFHTAAMIVQHEKLKVLKKKQASKRCQEEGKKSQQHGDNVS